MRGSVVRPTTLPPKLRLLWMLHAYTRPTHANIRNNKTFVMTHVNVHGACSITVRVACLRHCTQNVKYQQPTASVPIFRGGFRMARRNRCLWGTQLSDGGSKILLLGGLRPPKPPRFPRTAPSRARVFRIGAPMTFGEY